MQRSYAMQHGRADQARCVIAHPALTGKTTAQRFVGKSAIKKSELKGFSHKHHVLSCERPVPVLSTKQKTSLTTQNPSFRTSAMAVFCQSLFFECYNLQMPRAKDKAMSIDRSLADLVG